MVVVVVPETQVALIVDQKASGTGGGTASAGWNVRTLNTEIYDDDAIASLSGTNGFTLEPGEYLIEWSAPAYRCQRNQTALSTSTSDANIIALGSSEYAQDVESGTQIQDQSVSTGSFKVNIAAATTYHILHWVSNLANTPLFGVPTDNSEPEIYTQVRITNLAGVTVNAAGDVNHITYNGAAAWGSIAADGTIQGSLNVDSVAVTGGSQSLYTITFDTPMPNNNYSVTATANDAQAGNSRVPTIYSKTTTEFRIATRDSSGTGSPADFSFAVHALNALPPQGGTGTDAWGVVDANGVNTNGAAALLMAALMLLRSLD